MAMVKKCRHVKRGEDPRLCGCTWYGDVYLGGKRTYVKLGANYREARAAYLRLSADILDGPQ